MKMDFYFLAVSYNISITGIEDLGEGDNATITCTLSGLLYEPSLTRFVLFSTTGGNEAAKALISNTTLYTKTTIYNNVSKTYVSSIVSPPIPIVRHINGNGLLCTSIVNTTTINKIEVLNVNCKY